MGLSPPVRGIGRPFARSSPTCSLSTSVWVTHFAEAAAAPTGPRSEDLRHRERVPGQAVGAMDARRALARRPETLDSGAALAIDDETAVPEVTGRRGLHRFSDRSPRKVRMSNPPYL